MPYSPSSKTKQTLAAIGLLVTIVALIGGLFYYASSLDHKNSPTLGATIYAAADFRSSLAAPISASATALTLVSTSTASGEALVQGRVYGFKLGGREYVLGTLSSGKTITSLTRGVSLITGTSTGGIAEAWGRGTAVEITDAPVLLDIANKMNGIANLDVPLTYAPGTVFSTSTPGQVPSISFLAGFANVASTSVYNQITRGNNTYIGSTTYSGGGGLVLSYAPSNPLDAATKAYVDSFAGTGCSNADSSTRGCVQEATKAQILAGTASGSTGARLYVNPAILTSVGYKNMDYYAATSSFGVINNVGMGLSTTTGMVTGQTIQIWASCDVNLGSNTSYRRLDVFMPLGGTTTLSRASGSGFTTNAHDTFTLFGTFTATTTANLYIAVDNDSGNMLSDCEARTLQYQRFTN